MIYQREFETKLNVGIVGVGEYCSIPVDQSDIHTSRAATQVRNTNHGIPVFIIYLDERLRLGGPL